MNYDQDGTNEVANETPDTYSISTALSIVNNYVNETLKATQDKPDDLSELRGQISEAMKAALHDEGVRCFNLAKQTGVTYRVAHTAQDAQVGAVERVTNRVMNLIDATLNPQPAPTGPEPDEFRASNGRSQNVISGTFPFDVGAFVNNFYTMPDGTIHQQNPPPAGNRALTSIEIHGEPPTQDFGGFTPTHRGKYSASRYAIVRELNTPDRYSVFDIKGERLSGLLDATIKSTYVPLPDYSKPWHVGPVGRKRELTLVVTGDKTARDPAKTMQDMKDAAHRSGYEIKQSSLRAY